MNNEDTLKRAFYVVVAILKYMRSATARLRPVSVGGIGGGGSGADGNGLVGGGSGGTGPGFGRGVGGVTSDRFE
jgi:hypothetical protein